MVTRFGKMRLGRTAAVFERGQNILWPYTLYNNYRCISNNSTTKLDDDSNKNNNNNNDDDDDNSRRDYNDLSREYSDGNIKSNTLTANLHTHLGTKAQDNLLAANTIELIDKEDAPAESLMTTQAVNFFGEKAIQSLQREQPPRGSGIQPLLDFNKQWAHELAQLNPRYFAELAKQQQPQYLWIGCSDSRVPANEIVGLYPGDVFVHRNVANVVCSSDLNALAVIQYAVDCLKVEHVIVAGHYNCGGVTAALNENRVGLADHWILHVASVKKRYWRRMIYEIPARNHLNALCELNVLAQVENIVESHIIQRVWSRQNAEDVFASAQNKPIPLHTDEVEIHGWIYQLDDGIIRPLLTLNRHSNVEKQIRNAVDSVFYRHSQM